MGHLASLGMVHRDLAARNVLVDSTYAYVQESLHVARRVITVHRAKGRVPALRARWCVRGVCDAAPHLARAVLLPCVRRCKVADFGLSRQMDNDYYRASSSGAIPLRWTAIEMLTARKEAKRCGSQACLAGGAPSQGGAAYG